MAGETYFKTEVLYAGGAVQQYIATNPISFAGADGTSPPGQGVQDCPPDTPPRDPTPQPVEPPPPPCIDIPGYDKCVQIAPMVTGVCGETWISWNDGIVWERTYDHEPQDEYYWGEAREYVWNIYYGGSRVVQSGIVALMPGAFTPGYGNDYDELHGLWVNYQTGGGGSGIDVKLNSDGSKGDTYGIPYSFWGGTNVQRAITTLKFASQDFQASQITGDMFPFLPHDSFLNFLIKIQYANVANVTLDHWYWCDQYYSNGMTVFETGYMSDTQPISFTWDTDPNYPLGASSVTDFTHFFHWKFLHTPGIKHPCTGENCGPWGSWYCCRTVGSDWRKRCPDAEVPFPDNPTYGVNGTDPCPPHYSPWNKGCSGSWSNDNYDDPANPRHVHYTADGASNTVGVSEGQSAGDEFQQLWGQNQTPGYHWSGNQAAFKQYLLMPCQPVARHYTNVRSLPDPSSFDGVEEYTVDDQGVAHRWIWSDADRKWFEHGEKPAPDGGVI